MIKQRGWGKAPKAKGSPGERGEAAKKVDLLRPASLVVRLIGRDPIGGQGLSLPSILPTCSSSSSRGDSDKFFGQ